MSSGDFRYLIQKTLDELIESLEKEIEITKDLKKQVEFYDKAREKEIEDSRKE